MLIHHASLICFGLRAPDLHVRIDPRAALAAELAASGTALIHVSIDVNEKVCPSVPPGAANCDVIDAGTSPSGAADGRATLLETEND